MTTLSRGGRPADTARRSIHFFRIDGGAGDDGVPINVDLHPALRKLDALPFLYAENGGRYVTSGDADQCAWVDEVGEICKVRFANVRRNALPLAEAGGQLTDLNLAADAGLYEVSHLCIFPDGIVGMEFNFYGPRPSRLAPYLQRSVGREGCPEFTLEALLRQDVAAVLLRKKAVRKLDLSVRRPYIDVIEGANASLGAALRAAETASRADCVGVYLEPEPYQRRNLDGGIMDMLRGLVQRSDLRENTRTLKATVVDQDDRTEEIDLLRDELISQKKVLRQHGRTRVLLSDDAYAKIEEAYNEGRDDLTRAASVTLATT